ncbi:DUF6281 family protein [Streptomyces sp. AC550_RSS872]|uniref:DUF6281 family protein n=1 Tax=Streptomyces sp. AC550_RSS872 TaxID=2823689 RepID=UPI001C26FF98|nr:DUF6281 family protein [Streptomyces sp. AC550_RSS872]
MTTALRAGRRLLMTSLLLAAAAAGCAGPDGAGPDGAGPDGAGVTAEASCAYVVTYDGRTYLDVVNVDFTVGEKLGTATVQECDDTPDDAGDEVPERRVAAYEVEGADPAVTIAVGDTRASATLMKVRKAR